MKNMHATGIHRNSQRFIGHGNKATYREVPAKKAKHNITRTGGIHRYQEATRVPRKCRGCKFTPPKGKPCLPGIRGACLTNRRRKRRKH